MDEVTRGMLPLKEFLKHISSINNLFDLMAMCINYILKVIAEQEFDAIDVLNASDNKYPEIIGILDRYTQEKEIDMESRCLERLKTQLYNNLFQEREVINQCIQIIMWVDDNCEPRYENDGICTYKALNSQFDNMIRIIPHMNNRIDDFSSTFLDEKGQEVFRKDYPVRKVFYSNIVCKYIILDENFLNDYEVQIHHLGYGNAFVNKTIDKQRLSFAVFPVLNCDISEYFQLKEIDAKGIAYFEIDGMYQGREKALKQRYSKILNSCHSENIDFLIFPEMLMTENILNNLQGRKKENWLVFCGSVWRNRTNRCIVIGPDGQEILSYDKKVGFELKEGSRVYLEHLKERMRKVPYALLDIEGIGRVGVCICRDLTFQEVCNLHACMETNILIVPAFSGSGDLYTGAEELAKKGKCIVLLANSCSAYYNKRHKEKTTAELGFLVAPAKKGSARYAYKEAYGNIQCIGECKKNCQGTLFTVDFSNRVDRDGLLTMEITKQAVIS